MKLKILNVKLMILVAFFIFPGCDDNPPPGIEISLPPVLSSPANNASDISIPVIFEWNASTGAISFALQISKDSLFANIVYDTSEITIANAEISKLNLSTKYYWHVNATNENGKSQWSEIWNFTTGSIPLGPVLSSPANNATEVSVPPTLVWNKSAGAASYGIQISTSNIFTSYAYNDSGTTDTIKQIDDVLSNSTQYYWRVNAKNIHGTSGWSEVRSFTTGKTCHGIPTVTYEGKTYNTVQIGDQCWLRENLDVGVMINGGNEQTNNGTIEKYCYDNHSANCAIHGGLYQWYEAIQYTIIQGARGICPRGWHIPTLTEFKTCSTYVGGDGNALKAIGQGIDDGEGTNISGFSALLAGVGNSDFILLSYFAYFWSSTWDHSTNPYFMSLDYIDRYIDLSSGGKENGISVRCIKD